MASFDLAYRFMQPHEWNQRRNFTNDPRDPGGATKFGITLRSWQSQGSLGDLDGDGDIDAEDVRQITEDQARAFYATRYWIWGRIQDDRLAAKLFDISVNLGPDTATRYLQQALQELGWPSLTVDGSLGPVTTKAANDADPGAVLSVLARIQAKHYEDWAAAKPERVAFRAGLLARATSMPEVVHA